MHFSLSNDFLKWLVYTQYRRYLCLPHLMVVECFINHRQSAGTWHPGATQDRTYLSNEPWPQPYRLNGRFLIYTRKQQDFSIVFQLFYRKIVKRQDISTVLGKTSRYSYNNNETSKLVSII